MPRMSGKYQYAANNPRTGRPCWGLQVTPHVAMKLERFFPQIGGQDTRGIIILTATAEVARDLAWFMDRYPLEPVNEVSRVELEKQAAAHIAGEEEVLRILGGQSPDYAGMGMVPEVEPRPYQLVVPAIARATGRVLCADALGLGKTLEGSLILCEPDALPAVVVAPTHLTRQWLQKLFQYYPWLRCHIVTKGTPYDPATRRNCGGDQPDVLIFNYPKLGGWGDELAGKTQTIIFDEADELRTGHQPGEQPIPRKYVAACMIAHRAKYRIELTSTPVHNYGDEIHSIIHVIDPDVLGTRDEFLRVHGGSGRTVSNPRALGSYLYESGLMVRRTRKDVGRELPPVSRIEQLVESDAAKLASMTDDIADMARLVLDSHANQQERYVAAGQLDLKLRHATGLAKAPFVAQFVKLLLEEEKKVLLTAWHRDCYQVYLDALAEFNPVMYTGTESPSQKNTNANRFINGDSRVLLLSLRSGAGIDGLQEVCSTVVFGEVDWTPARHTQIIGRLNRDGQTQPVAAFFCMSDAGSDPPMAEVLNLKKQQAEPMLDPDAELVQPSPQEALARVKALAKSVLHRTAGSPR
jgi:SNF2-related domain